MVSAKAWPLPPAATRITLGIDTGRLVLDAYRPHGAEEISPSSRATKPTTSPGRKNSKTTMHAPEGLSRYVAVHLANKDHYNTPGNAIVTVLRLPLRF